MLEFGAGLFQAVTALCTRENAVKPFFRKLHRWLGLLMALQILAWMASGLYFAIFPIETIRGEHLTVPAPPPEASSLPGLVPPAEAWAVLAATLDGDPELTAISLLNRFDSTWYRISGRNGGQPFTRLVNGLDGRLGVSLDEAQARALGTAMLAVPGRIESVEWVEKVEPDSEIRGRQLPVWKVSYAEPEALALYFDPWTGDLLARRTTRWRIFDFLWMLHIMDYQTRDNFNHPLLQIAASLGLLIALSGVLYWYISNRALRLSRRSGPARP